jgi:hypothetical protein
MIYKFKSKAGGDVIMMSPNGDQVMQLLGREPAAKGIFEAAALPAAIQALEAGVAQDDAVRAQAEADAKAKGEKLPPREGVSLRQRVWPLVELMRRAQAAGHEIVWGV